jgi:hypothetical protein
MARKAKIDNAILKRLRVEGLKRLEGTRTKRRRFLIVCEGEKTEPNYFNALKISLPKGVLDVCEFRIEGTGHNTESLVEKAVQLKDRWEKESQRPVDKLWVVFDKDSFTSESFNAAIEKCANMEGVDCAWSNEAFELWYLLHFNYYEATITRMRHQEMIEENFKSKGLENYKYAKNSEDMFRLLNEYGSLSDAIRNAKRLVGGYGSRRDYANHSPCTMVYLLIEELMALEDKI